MNPVVTRSFLAYNNTVTVVGYEARLNNDVYAFARILPPRSMLHEYVVESAKVWDSRMHDNDTVEIPRSYRVPTGEKCVHGLRALFDIAVPRVCKVVEYLQNYVGVVAESVEDVAESLERRVGSLRLEAAEPSSSMVYDMSYDNAWASIAKGDASISITYDPVDAGNAWIVALMMPLRPDGGFLPRYYSGVEIKPSGPGAINESSYGAKAWYMTVTVKALPTPSPSVTKRGRHLGVPVWAVALPFASIVISGRVCARIVRGRCEVELDWWLVPKRKVPDPVIIEYRDPNIDP